MASPTALSRPASPSTLPAHHPLPLHQLSPPHQPSPTYPSPSVQVLQLPELLEAILQHLSQKDLLLSQRTSTHFRTTTLSSPTLQRALFLLPDPAPLSPPFTSLASRHPGRKPENNRLLLRAFPGVLPTTTHVLVQEHFVVHPTSSSPELHTTERWTWSLSISFPFVPVSSSPAVEYPAASWRRMFLCQPPCKALHLVKRWQRSAAPVVVREEGVRMGEFVERVGRGWAVDGVSSDGDWHFEGVVGCEGERMDGAS